LFIRETGKKLFSPLTRSFQAKNNKADVPLTCHSHTNAPILFQFLFLIHMIIIYISFNICFNIIIFSKLDVQWCIAKKKERKKERKEKVYHTYKNTCALLLHFKLEHDMSSRKKDYNIQMYYTKGNEVILI
jgi:hypothetical protein